MASPRRRGAPSRLALIALFGASVGAHALAVLALALVGRTGAPPPSEPGEPAGELSPAERCALEAAAEAGLRALVCATPYYGDALACSDEPMRALELDLIRCRGRRVADDSSADEDLEDDRAEVAVLDPSELPEDPSDTEAPPDPADETAETDDAPPARPRPEAQVVEVPEGEDAPEPPEDTRFLAERDSRVDEETVARGDTREMAERPGDGEPSESERGETAEAERSGPDAPEQRAHDAAGEAEAPADEAEAPAADSAEADGSADDAGAGEREVAARADPESQRPGLEDGIEAPAGAGEIPILGDGRVPEWEELLSAADGDGGSGERASMGAPGASGGAAPDLRPSEELLADAMGGGGGSVDHLGDVREGESTALNTVQWKHAGFFNRVKRAVAQHWDPEAVYRARDPDGSTYSLRRRITGVRVSLREDGALDGVGVIRGSGVRALDDEAVRAFEAAAPFPNPPEDLVDEASGTLSFRFGFYFDVRRGWNIFRSR